MEAPPPVRPRFACRQITTAATQCLLQDDHLRTLDNFENPQNRREISQHAQDSQDYHVLFTSLLRIVRPIIFNPCAASLCHKILRQSGADLRAICVTYSCRTAERG